MNIGILMCIPCVRDSDLLGQSLAGSSCLKFLGERLCCNSNAGVPQVRTGYLAI
jgi:hypothetical protein